MFHAHRWFAALAASCLALAFSACGTPEQDPQDAASNDATDVGDATDTSSETVLPGDGVWLTFQVDDSANQTFGDGDMKWTGSFAWDETTNEVVPADSWLPSDGPYPLLYDDGPLSAGGHEKEGAVKGDHIFSTQVKFKAATETTFEYGVLNEFDNWMWVGPNGKLVVPAGATGVIDAPGQTLKKFGTIDMRVTLDTQALHPNFALWKPATHKFYLKGSMNQWTPVQLLDDGQKGDAVADDGIYTYVHLLNLGKHDGGLPAGDEVQFMFVATQGDALPEEGQEYKGAMKANAEGVEAWTGTGAGGAWESAAVLFAKDSKGKFENTAIVVPGGAACDPACKETEACVSGKCVAIAGCLPACEGGLQCIEGKCV
ncbi:MAG: choice-of-anchor X domain-containing protein, partial [Myxococcota bacterium]